MNNWSSYTSSQEMAAFDRLPKRLQSFLRTAPARFEAIEVEWLYEDVSRNEHLTLEILRANLKDALEEDIRDQDLSDMRRL